MPTPLSSETLVNLTTVGAQTAPAVAALTDGDSVAVWLDDGQARLRLLDINGQPTGGEVTIGPAAEVQVASLSGGGFVAVWFTGPASPSQVRSQMFDAAGHEVGAPQTLATYNDTNTPILGRHLYGLEVTGLSDGGFVTGWSNYVGDSSGRTAVFSQMAVVDGAGQIEANVGRTVESFNKIAPTDDPDLTFVELPGGKFLATWRDAQTFGPGVSDPGGQMGQLYDPHGAAIGSTFRLDTLTPADGGPAIDPRSGGAVAMSGDNLAFAWSSAGAIWVSLYPTAILGSGSSAGRTQPVNLGAAAPNASAGEPQVVALADGRLFVAWNDAAGDVHGRLVGVDGQPLGPSFRLGDSSQGVQDLIDVAQRPDGALVAVWRDGSGEFGDTSGTGVVAQVIWPDAGGQLGTANADTIIGGAGSDLLVGRGGADVLLGGAGVDSLSGGAGADKFILQMGAGADRIVDFQHGQDAILLFDATGAVAESSHALLVLDANTHVLSWDPDSDAGPAPLQAIGVMPDLSTLSRSDFAAGFQPSGVRIVKASGDVDNIVFDWANQAADYSKATYSAGGLLLTFNIYYDDGARSEGSYDSANVTAEWSRLVAEYDKTGQLFAYSAVLDDGSKSLWLYDTNNSKPWVRVHEEYDAQGRLTQQAMLNDDGTGAERHIDAADTQPWAYYIDNYADGRLLNHTFYNANGTVFAG